MCIAYAAYTQAHKRTCRVKRIRKNIIDTHMHTYIHTYGAHLQSAYGERGLDGVDSGQRLHGYERGGRDLRQLLCVQHRGIDLHHRPCRMLRGGVAPEAHCKISNTTTTTTISTLLLLLLLQLQLQHHYTTNTAITTNYYLHHKCYNHCHLY